MKKEKIARYEILEHTADIGIKAEADSIEVLFLTAAQAMFRIICPKGQVISKETYSVRVFGEDNQQLLVNWLSELNFLFQTRQFLLAIVDELYIKDQSLQARVTGERIEPLRHVITTEIKAVTYHQIVVERTDDGKWWAKVYFDI